MISQAKIDLAVLLKLFQHGEADGEPVDAREITELFSVKIPLHRIKAAFETLESRGEAIRQHDRYKEDEVSWRVSADGIRAVERAKRKPNSFIARLDSAGDNWLLSAEAAEAKLTKLPRYQQDLLAAFNNDPLLEAITPPTPPVHITNNFSPQNSVTVSPSSAIETKDRSGWWNLGAAIFFGTLAIVVTLWVSGKI